MWKAGIMILCAIQCVHVSWFSTYIIIGIFILSIKNSFLYWCRIVDLQIYFLNVCMTYKQLAKTIHSHHNVQSDYMIISAKLCSSWINSRFFWLIFPLSIDYFHIADFWLRSVYFRPVTSAFRKFAYYFLALKGNSIRQELKHF